MNDILDRIRRAETTPLHGTEKWVELWKVLQDARDEISHLREAVRSLADQDATLSVCDGAVTVTMDGTLTDAEREFLQALHDAYQEMANQTGSVNAATQADSRKNAATLRGLLERMR